MIKKQLPTSHFSLYHCRERGWSGMAQACAEGMMCYHPLWFNQASVAAHHQLSVSMIRIWVQKNKPYHHVMLFNTAEKSSQQRREKQQVPAPYLRASMKTLPQDYSRLCRQKVQPLKRLTRGLEKSLLNTPQRPSMFHNHICFVVIMLLFTFMVVIHLDCHSANRQKETSGFPFAKQNKKKIRGNISQHPSSGQWWDTQPI